VPGDAASGNAFVLEDFDLARFAAVLTDWRRRAQAALAARYPEAELGEPVIWDAALFRSARNRAEGLLDREAALLGTDWRKAPDRRLHVCLADDRLFLALEAGGRVLGPIDVPVRLVAGRFDDVRIWLDGLSMRPAVHDDPRDMPGKGIGAVH
jgi:hypothetical protein